MEFQPDDVNRLAKAHEEIGALKKFIAERAELFHQMKTKNENLTLRNENGYAIRIPEWQIFNPGIDTINVESIDVQSRDTTGRIYQTPKTFIFGELTEEAKEYQTYINLKTKFTK